MGQFCLVRGGLIISCRVPRDLEGAARPLQVAGSEEGLKERRKAMRAFYGSLIGVVELLMVVPLAEAKSAPFPTKEIATATGSEQAGLP